MKDGGLRTQKGQPGANRAEDASCIFWAGDAPLYCWVWGCDVRQKLRIFVLRVVCISSELGNNGRMGMR